MSRPLSFTFLSSGRRDPPLANCADFAKIDIMPTLRDSRPLTNEQAVQLRHDLTLIEERLQDIVVLMRVCYGEDSQPVVRADETAAALQRLKWELERTKLRSQAADLAVEEG